MKKRTLAMALAACLLLSGCAALLERSYSLVEPYADRYWDSGEEDTLKVDNYQDLVNSLVMLIEQRAEEAVVRCYDEVSTYQQVLEARDEVRWETMKGSYLLLGISFTFEDGANYGTAAFSMLYREDAEDLSGVMMLSDSQSLVDLLRLAIREDHEKITAQFIYDTPREAVTAAVESYWQELCRDEMEDAVFASEPDIPAILPDGETGESLDSIPEEDLDEAPADEPEDAPPLEDGEEEPKNPGDPDSGTPEEGTEEPEAAVYPPCPWVVRFYPNRETAELVEIQLKKS